MNDDKDNNTPNPKTIEFVYYEGQKILGHYLSAADSLDTKIIAVFSTATILIGVVPPLIYSDVSQSEICLLNDWRTLLLMILAGVCYLLIFFLSLKSCLAKFFGLVPRLRYVYDNIDKSSVAIMEQIVKKYIRKAYKANVANLKAKNLTLKIIIIATGFEAIFLFTLFIIYV